MYRPKREVAIDESMCKHTGRSEHVQYMKNKPIEWGLKIWALAESLSGKCLIKKRYNFAGIQICAFWKMVVIGLYWIVLYIFSRIYGARYNTFTVIRGQIIYKSCSFFCRLLSQLLPLLLTEEGSQQESLPHLRRRCAASTACGSCLGERPSSVHR